MKTVYYILLFIFIGSFLHSQNTTVNKNGDKVKLKGLSLEQFQGLINKQNKAVLIHFEADWCLLCKKLNPILDEIAVERKDRVEVLSINTDDNPIITKHFEVDGLPIMILYKHGKIVWSIQGFLSKKEILGNLDLYQ